MSVLFGFENCFLVSHEEYINGIYKDSSVACEIKTDLFNLNVPYQDETSTMIPNKKRRKKPQLTENVEIEADRKEFELIDRIKCKTKVFIAECRKNKMLPKQDDQECNNTDLKRCLRECQSVVDNYLSIEKFNGGNISSDPVVSEIESDKFLIPPNCKFYNDDIQNISKIKFDDKFDLIVIDPPWWNKYIRRTKQFQRNNGYDMMSNDLIRNIPIEKLIGHDKTLVAIWCTNAPSLIKTVIESFLPKWKLKLVATWYWIKITKFGETICDFNIPRKKQPFERLFIACPIDCDQAIDIDEERLIFSIPSALHSHKPPLKDLLAQHLEAAQKANGLELFARYLLPNFTSIGYEVLKLQNLQLYKTRKRNYGISN